MFSIERQRVFLKHRRCAFSFTKTPTPRMTASSNPSNIVFYAFLLRTAVTATALASSSERLQSGGVLYVFFFYQFLNLPSSIIENRASSIEPPSSSIEHRASSIEPRLSPQMPLSQPRYHRSYLLYLHGHLSIFIPTHVS